MKSDDEGIGTALDQFQWDYEPPAVESRFFLKPVSAFFCAFKWEGQGEQSPVTTGRIEDQT